MNTNLVHTWRGEVFTSSKIISDLLEVDHVDLLRTVEKVVKRHKKLSAGVRTAFPQMFKESSFKNKQNRTYKMYEMNEQAYLKLVMQLSGYEKAEVVQDQMIEAFSMMKQMLMNKENAVFVENRERGKEIRSNQTDAIKELTEYAEVERNAPISYPLYSTYTQMTNKHIRFLMDTKEGRPLRDMATVEQLGFIMIVDGRVERCIRDGINRKLPYKEIYQYCKNEVEKLVDSLCFKPLLSI